MRLELKKYLYDIQHALDLKAEFTAVAHGYAEVDDRLVWEIVETKLPVLRREVEALLRQA